MGLSTIAKRFPYAPCMEYLPTFGWFCSGKCWEIVHTWSIWDCEQFKEEIPHEFPQEIPKIFIHDENTTVLVVQGVLKALRDGFDIHLRADVNMVSITMAMEQQ